MEYRVTHYDHDIFTDDNERPVCAVDSCENLSTHCVSYDTRHSLTNVTFVGSCVCENHVEQYAQELWDELGPTDGKTTEIIVIRI
jgi:hypothetical protein